MGRIRNTSHHLPERVYQSKGWHFYVDKNGKWHKLGREWDKEARDAWVRITTGKAADGTVAELLDAFYEHCEAMVREGKRAKRTLEDNDAERRVLKLTFGRMHYGAVTSKHCASYLRKRTDKNGKPAPIRANRELAFMSSAYSWGMGEDRFDIKSNPCYGVRRNTETPRDRYVETAEVRTFTSAAYCPAWLRCWVLLKRLTALRQGDMLRINDAHLTDRGIKVQIGKTGQHRIIRWSWALRTVITAAQSLREPLPENVELIAPRPLFPGRYGSGLSMSGFKSAWQRAMAAHAAAGHARFWEHDIRAKSGSDAENDQRAQDLLGHETTKTTRRHYRRGPSKVRPLR